MSDEYDTRYTDNIVCPYCGDEDIDSWEAGKDVQDGELGVLQCGNCEKKFRASRHLEVRYYSYKTPCQNGECEHDWKPVVGVPKEYFANKRDCSLCGERRTIEKEARR